MLRPISDAGKREKSMTFPFDGKLYKYERLRRDLSRYVFANRCAIRIDKQQKVCYK